MTFPKRLNPMKKALLLLLIGMMASAAFCQKTELAGHLVDTQNHQPLPYGTIELFRLRTGTIANDQGAFSLAVSDLQATTDSLRFSCLGYLPFLTSAGDFLALPDKTILLQEDHILLPDVTVVPKKYKLVTVGITSGKPESKQITNLFNSWIGNYIANKRGQTGWIRSVSYFLDKEGHPETPFRVRIFSVNPNNKFPGKDLLHENVITTAKQAGWLTVDLSNYHLPFPTEGIFVVMEWINAGDGYFYEKEMVRRGKNGEEIKEQRRFYGQAIGSLLNQPEMVTWGVTLGNQWVPYSLYYKGYINAMIHAEIAFPAE